MYHIDAAIRKLINDENLFRNAKYNSISDSISLNQEFMLKDFYGEQSLLLVINLNQLKDIQNINFDSVKRMVIFSKWGFIENTKNKSMNMRGIFLQNVDDLLEEIKDEEEINEGNTENNELQ